MRKLVFGLLKRWLAAVLLCMPLWLLAQQDSIRRQAQPNSLQQLQAMRDAQLNPAGRIYSKASQLKDHHTAIYALHVLLLDDPDNVYLQDSLAMHYFLAGNHESCLRWSNSVLESRPDDPYLLVLTANIYAQRRDFKPALARHERLQELRPSFYNRYRIAMLQYELGRTGECGTTIEQLLLKPEIDQEAVHVRWGDGGADIPLRAALLNLRGNLQEQLNRDGDARKSFREALKLAPDFQLARNNLNALREKNDRYRDNDR